MSAVGRRFILIAVAGACLCALPARAEDQVLSANLSCRPEASPGRVLCEVELEVSAGRLPWADALVTAAPAFVRPLRSRVGPRQAGTRQATRIRLPIALVATASGKGKVSVRARAVVCHKPSKGPELCLPRTRELSTMIRVGPIRER